MLRWSRDSRHFQPQRLPRRPGAHFSPFSSAMRRASSAPLGFLFNLAAHFLFRFDGFSSAASAPHGVLSAWAGLVIRRYVDWSLFFFRSIHASNLRGLTLACSSAARFASASRFASSSIRAVPALPLHAVPALPPGQLGFLRIAIYISAFLARLKFAIYFYRRCSGIFRCCAFALQMGYLARCRVHGSGAPAMFFLAG